MTQAQMIATQIQQAHTDMDFAMKRVGECLIAYYKSGKASSDFDNLCFWQQQAAYLAEEIAKMGE